jgi:hypothetical protein
VWSRCSTAIFISTPPAECTMPFGTPVVPDENRMKSGWAKGRRSKRGAGPPLAASPAKSRAPSSRAPPRKRIPTTCSTVGRPAQISATRSASGGPCRRTSRRGEQDLGLDLAEAVEHAAHAEVGRARGPDGAERGRRQHRDDGLGAVGQDARDPIARAHADPSQPRGERADLRAQLRERQLAARAVLAGKDQRGAG